MIWHGLKRWLYLVHRWIGIATCLLFVMWFASGLVMLYVPFPSLDAGERLAGQQPIAWEKVLHEPAADGTVPDVREIALEMRGDRPIWRMAPWSGEPYAIWADTGTWAGPADLQEASRIAERFDPSGLAEIRQIHNDQWSVPDGFNHHRPLWKAEMEGDLGRVLYISSVTGEVLLETTAGERFWNWLGSIPHWLYPRALREEQPAWRQVVMWVSGPCILAALTGIWIGLMRLRTGRKRFKGGRMTPYLGWTKWHHVSGLIGSIFLILWIFSGWLSVDPFRLFASSGIGQDAYRAYAGAQPLPIPDQQALARIAPDARRIAVSSAAGRPFISIQQHNKEGALLEAATLAPLLENTDRILPKVGTLVQGAEIAGVETLRKPDAYWYSVNGEAPLPVLRVRFADKAESWVHIDLRSGAILGEADARRRTYRWLFDLFHRWDLNLLLKASPARDILIWLMSLAGLISSLSAVYIGWKRLRRPRRQQATG